MDRRILLSGLALVGAVGLAGIGTSAGQAPKRLGPDPKELNGTIAKAVTYLKAGQAEDGSWSRQSSPGITGVVLYALLRSGQVTDADPVVAKALKYIESLANAEAGHLAGSGSRVRQPNYLTSVNLLAILAADRQRRYAALTDKAVTFLKAQPYDESKGKDRKDPYYGGVGYDGSTRPDVSNTVFLLEALEAAKVPVSDPVYSKIAVYVSRSQDLKSEFNDQPWAGKINDGGFNYGAGPAGQPRGTNVPPDAPRPGYGSITCSGLLSLSICGVKKDDVRARKALEWIQKNYTAENNPGWQGPEQGYYLYLRMLSTVLDRLGLDTVTDGQNQVHDWRAEVAAALKSRQRPDGSWSNKTGVWMEANADLATSWALLALSNCKSRP